MPKRPVATLAYELEELPEFPAPPPLEPLYGHVFKPDLVNPLCAECGYRLIEHPLRPVEGDK